MRSTTESRTGNEMRLNFFFAGADSVLFSVVRCGTISGVLISGSAEIDVLIKSFFVCKECDSYNVYIYACNKGGKTPRCCNFCNELFHGIEHEPRQTVKMVTARS